MSKKKNRKFKKVKLKMIDAYPPTNFDGTIASFMVSCEMRSIEYGDYIPIETWYEIVEEAESRNT